MPPSVLELVVLSVALVVDGDNDAAVQERELAQPLREGVEAVLDGFENLCVGLERDFCAAALRGAGDLEGTERRSPLVDLLIDLAVAPDLQVESLGQRVHH